MNKHIYSFLILLIHVCCVPILSYGQKQFDATRVTVQNGLSQDDVLHLFQDSRNLLWISTPDGLNRYDGYDFKHFNLMDGMGLDAALIHMVAEDKCGDLWVATDNGLFIYYRSTGTFKALCDLSDMTIPAARLEFKNITIDDEGAIWAYALKSEEIYKISYDYTHQSLLSVTPLSDFVPNRVHALHTSHNKVFIACAQGLYIYDLSTHTLVNKHPKAAVQDLAVGDHEQVFFLSNNNLCLYEHRTDTTILLHKKAGLIKLAYFDKTLYLITRQDMIVAKCGPHRVDSWDSISNIWGAPFRDITVDDNGSIWISIHRNGLVRLDKRHEYIELYQQCGTNDIQTLQEDRLGQTWVGTLASGLYVLDKHYRLVHNVFEGHLVQYITQASVSHDMYLIVVGKGIYRCRENTYQFEKIFAPYARTTRMVLCLDDYLWMATYDNGLIRLNLKTNDYKQFTVEDGLPSNIVRNVYEDRNGNLWIATKKGLSLVSATERTQDTISFANNLSGEYIMSMMEDREGNVWVGTLGSGLKKTRLLDNRLDLLQTYSTANGLSNNMIKSIQEDEFGNIWMSTNKGINSINPVTGDIKTYAPCDGLQGYEFQDLSTFKTEGNALLFGGRNGFNVIHPRKLVQDTVAVMPILTDFKLFNASIVASPLFQKISGNSIIDTDKVTLKHHQNSFSFSFAAPYYVKSQKIRYTYLLEGFDKEWMTASATQRVASYTNIPPGNYTFRLKTSNYDEIWNNKELRVAVTIAFPWWNTWQAYVGYVLCFFLITYLIVWYTINNIRKKEAMETAQFEKKKSEEMLEIRTNFYTNISHELRTPLTLILSPIQLIIGDKDNYLTKESAKLLNSIQHNGESLKRLINNLMDFSKNEKGMLTMHHTNNTISSHIESMVSQFEYWCKDKNIVLQFQSSVKDLVVSYDMNFMEQVMYNLLSNAVKYTPKGGAITVSLRLADTHPIIRVQDTGVGMSDAQKQHVFERFYSKRADSTSIEDIGIGLYITKVLVEMQKGQIGFESEEHVGTSFIITLPEITQANYIETSISKKLVDIEKEKTTPILVDDSSDKPLLLIVDDNKHICLLLKGLFEDTFKIMIATDGLQAWENSLRFMPDIIISDVMMPVMDGYELCKKIKSDRFSSHIPVVLLTAKNAAADQLTGYKLQADGYCTKPFDHAILKEMVLSILTNRKLAAQNNAKLQLAAIDKKVEKTVLTELDQQLVNQVEAELETHISDSKYTIGQLCESIGVSRFILNKKFKALYETTPVNFLRDYRLKKAAELLTNGNHTISEVTYYVGFSDLKHFRNCFKEKYDMLPLDYKNKYNPHL